MFTMCRFFATSSLLYRYRAAYTQCIAILKFDGRTYVMSLFSSLKASAIFHYLVFNNFWKKRLKFSNFLLFNYCNIIKNMHIFLLSLKKSIEDKFAIFIYSQEAKSAQKSQCIIRFWSKYYQRDWEYKIIENNSGGNFSLMMLTSKILSWKKFFVQETLQL